MVGRETHHHSLTGEDYKDDHPKEERKEFRKKRREARQEARKGFDKDENIDKYSNAREKAIAATREETKVLWGQIAKETLKVSREEVVRYLDAIREIDVLTAQLKRSPNNHILEKSLNDALGKLRKVRGELRQAVRRHIDFEVDNPPEYLAFKANLEYLKDHKIITQQVYDDALASVAVPTADADGADKKPPASQPPASAGQGSDREGGDSKKNQRKRRTRQRRAPRGAGPSSPQAPTGAPPLDTIPDTDPDPDIIVPPKGTIPDESDDGGGGDRGGERPDEALKQLREQNRETAGEAFGALEKYWERHQEIVAKLEPGVPAANSRFSFIQELAQLGTTKGALEGLRATLEQSVQDDDATEQVAAHAKALKKAIESANKTLKEYDALYEKAERVHTEMEQVEGLILPLLQGMELPASTIAGIPTTDPPDDASPELKELWTMVHTMVTLEMEFNKSETTIERHKTILDELDPLPDAYKPQIELIKKLEDKKDVVFGTGTDQNPGKFPIVDNMVKGLNGSIEHLKTEVATQPTAWSSEKFTGGHRWFSLSGLSNAWDQLRDNVYHARFGSERSRLAAMPDLNAELRELSGIKMEVRNLFDAFEAATTVEQRLRTLEALEKKLDDLSHQETGALKSLADRVEAAYASANATEPTLEDSWVGWLTPGNLDAVSKTQWAQKSPSWYGKSGRYLGQYGLGVGSAVEGLAKWGVGMVAGAPGLIQTVPQFGKRLLTGDFAGARAAIDNNTLTGTVATVAWDGVWKNVVGGLGKLGTVFGVHGDDNENAWSRYGGWDADNGNWQNNHLNAAVGTLAKGVFDWASVFWAGDSDVAGNGYHLGQTVGTVATILAGGAAAGGAGAVRGGLALRGSSAAGTGGRIDRAISATARLPFRAGNRIPGVRRPTAWLEARTIDPGLTATTRVLKTPQILPRLRFTQTPRLAQLEQTVTQMRARIAAMPANAETLRMAETFARNVVRDLKNLQSRIGQRQQALSQAIEEAVVNIEAGLTASARTGQTVMSVMEAQLVGVGGTSSRLASYATLIDSFSLTPVGPGARFGASLRGRLGSRVSRGLNRPSRGPILLRSLGGDTTRAATDVNALLVRGETGLARATVEGFANRLMDDLTELSRRTPAGSPGRIALEAGITDLRTILTDLQNPATHATDALMTRVESLVNGTAAPGIGAAPPGLIAYATFVDVPAALGRTARGASAQRLVNLERQLTELGTDLGRLPAAEALQAARTVSERMVAQFRQVADALDATHPLVATELRTTATTLETVSAVAVDGMTLHGEMIAARTAIRPYIGLSDTMTLLARPTGRIARFTERFRSSPRLTLSSLTDEVASIKDSLAELNRLATTVPPPANAAALLDLATETSTRFAQKVIDDLDTLEQQLGKRSPIVTREIEAARVRIRTELAKPTTAPAGAPAPAAGTLRTVNTLVDAVESAVVSPVAPGAATGLTQYAPMVEQLLNAPGRTRRVAGGTAQRLESGYEWMLRHPYASMGAGETFIMGTDEDENPIHTLDVIEEPS